MLTQALAGEPISQPALAGSELGLAALWFRDRVTALLSGALRPRELLESAAGCLRAEPESENAPSQQSNRGDVSWQRAAAVTIAAAEVAGEGRHVDQAMVRYLTADPDGMLAAMAELAARLYRLHDGLGAPAVVRALRP